MHVFVKFTNIKFHKNRFSSSCVTKHIQTNKEMKQYDCMAIKHLCSTLDEIDKNHVENSFQFVQILESL